MCSSSSHSVRGIVCHTGVCTCSLNAATKHAVGRVSVSVAVGRTYKEESRCKSALPLGRSHQPRRFCSPLVRRVPLPLTLYAPSAVGLCSVFPLTPPPAYIHHQRPLSHSSLSPDHHLAPHSPLSLEHAVPSLLRWLPSMATLGHLVNRQQLSGML